MSSFFSPNTHSKNVLCRDDTIHAIKFPCYDLTYSNAASGLYSACIFELKTTVCESTIKKYLWARVRLARSAYLCLRWGSFKGF